MYADIPTSEVEVITRKGKVKAEQLVSAVNHAQDSAHSFRATLKSGPKPVE